MSRTRIVKGTYTKISAKGHNMYSNENIITTAGKFVTEEGTEKGLSLGLPKSAPKLEYTDEPDFDIELELIEKDFVPLGVPDYKGNPENDKIQFELTVKGKGINQWNLMIKHGDDILYESFSSSREIQEVVVTAKKKNPKAKSEDSEDLTPVVVKRYWPAGKYILSWTGFDKNGIYDSTVLKSEKGLTVSIVGQAEFKKKTVEIEKPIKFTHKEVDWVDVKIDKKNKKIDTTLRVNLKDGGEEGLSCKTIGPNAFEPSMQEITVCDWDKIPKGEIKPKQPIIKTRTRTFEDLKQLALDGINKHWRRIGNHFLEIGSDNYQITTTSINTNFKSLNPLDLIFNTNDNWGRSGNAGVLGKIYYNVGYCNFLDWYQPSFIDDWGYLDTIKDKVDEDFMYTAAHELGHTILRAYGGTWYSFTHDDSSEIWQTPNGKKSYPLEKSTGEINLMHYYKDDPYQFQYDYNLIMASKEDIRSLIWLTKIKNN